MGSYFIAYHHMSLHFSIFSLVFQLWTLKFFINAGQWQSLLGIFSNFFLVLGSNNFNFLQPLLAMLPHLGIKKKFFFNFFSHVGLPLDFENFLGFIHPYAFRFIDVASLVFVSHALLNISFPYSKFIL